MINPLLTTVIYDIDGTLCNTSQIMEVLNHGEDAFIQATQDCLPYEVMADQLHQDIADHNVVILTARPDTYRELTQMWLDAHGLEYGELVMLPEFSFQTPVEFKRQVWKKIQRISDIVRVYEDNPDIIEALQQDGIPVTRAPGWEHYIP